MATTHIKLEMPTRQKWLLLGIVVGSLVVMAFYTVTDAAHLASSQVLDGADWMGYALCHRITERSFAIYGRQLPLCARCTGMYLGVFVAGVVLWLTGKLRHADLPPLPALLVLMGFIGIMGIDGVNSYSHFFPQLPHLYEPRNWLRLLTGMGTGLAMGVMVAPALAQTLWAVPRYQPVVETWPEFLRLVAAGGTAVILVLSNQPALLYVLALASVAGQLLVVAALNTVVFLMILRRDGRAVRWRETAVPLLIGLALAIIELSLISLFRFNLTGGIMAGFPGL
ncbi:MAG: hypothetical protein Kow0080_15500 [Candidatus Promineifilaceae bacterium]